MKVIWRLPSLTNGAALRRLPFKGAGFKSPPHKIRLVFRGLGDPNLHTL